jgi:glycerophosphoryl diester phosphodiesterase
VSFEELQRFDVGRLRPGSEYAGRFPQQKPVDGARIPRLTDLFAQAGPAVRFNIETKLTAEAPNEALPPESFARALIAEIRKAGMERRTTIQSFDWRTLKVVEQEAPDIATAYLTGSKNADPEKVHAAGGRTWSPDFQTLTGEKMQAARRLGLKVIPWTVNERADITRMLEFKADGIISDYPDRVREVLQRRGLLPL